VKDLDGRPDKGRSVHLGSDRGEGTGAGGDRRLRTAAVLPTRPSSGWRHTNRRSRPGTGWRRGSTAWWRGWRRHRRRVGGCLTSAHAAIYKARSHFSLSKESVESSRQRAAVEEDHEGDGRATAGVISARPRSRSAGPCSPDRPRAPVAMSPQVRCFHPERTFRRQCSDGPRELGF